MKDKAKNKKFLLLQESDRNNYSIRRYLEESNKIGIDLIHARYSELEMKFENNSYYILFQGEDIIEKYDYFLCRSTKFKNELRSHYIHIIKYLAKRAGKYSLNQGYSFSHYSKMTKAYNYAVLASNNIPIIPTHIFSNTEQLEQSTELVYPLIIKPAQGSKGEGVELMYSKEDIFSYLAKYRLQISDTIIQKYIIASEKISKDLRVIGLGGNAVGAIQRSASKDKVITNYSAGGTVSKAKLTQEIRSIVSKTMNIFNLDYAGFDFIYDKEGRVYLIEINPAAQFEGFEQATNSNIPSEVLKFLLSK